VGIKKEHRRGLLTGTRCALALLFAYTLNECP